MFDVIRVSDQCYVDFTRQKIHCCDKEVNSSKIGNRAWIFLSMLIEAEGRILTYDMLEDSDIWPDDHGAGVDHKPSLKTWASAFNQAFGAKIILCKRGCGYYYSQPVIPAMVLREKSPYILPNKIFIRTEETDTLANALINNKVVFITGLDGIGKTTFLGSFLQKRRNQLQINRVVYIKYKNSLVDCFADDMTVTIEGLNRRFVAQDKMEDNQAYATRKISVLNQLVSENDLFVVDDLNQEDPFLQEIMKLNSKLVVLTNRNLLDNNYYTLTINPLSCADAKALFFMHYSRNDLSFDCGDLHELLDLVGRHTLSVVLIAKQMMINRKTPKEMMELFQSGVVQNMEEEIRLDPLGCAKPVRNFLIELFKFERLTEDELKILYFLCMISPAPVKVKDLAEWIPIKRPFRTIDNLVYYGWVEYDYENDLVFVHSIIKEVIRYGSKMSVTDYAGELNHMLEDIDGFELFALSDDQKKYYARIFASLCSINVEDKQLLIPFYTKAERVLSISRESRNVHLSISVSLLLEKLFLKTPEKTRFELGYILYCRGWTYFTQLRNKAKGLQLYSEAVELIRTVPDMSLKQMAILSEIYADVGLAICRSGSGDMKEAAVLISNAINIYKKIMPEKVSSYLRLSWLLSFLSECFIKQNELDKAEEMIASALKLHSTYSVERDVFLCNIEYRESKLKRAKKDYDAALKVAKDAFDIYFKYFPTTSISNIEHLVYLGELNNLLEQFSEAKRYYSEALFIASKYYDEKLDIISRIKAAIQLLDDRRTKDEGNLNHISR